MLHASDLPRRTAGGLLLLLACLLPLQSLAQRRLPTIPALEAIQQKVIDCQAFGRYNIHDKSEYTDADGQYYGKCMSVQLKNRSQDSISVFIEEGTMLASEDSTVQDMLITKHLYVLLGPKQSKTYPLYAMCSEIHDLVPHTQTPYRIAQCQDRELVSIAHAIGRSYMQNIIGQGAVWIHTDGASEEDLKRYGATDETIGLSLGILKKAGVNSRLAATTDLPVPEADQAHQQDSIITAMSGELSYLNALLKFKAEKMELEPALVYTGLGAIVLLFGTTLLLVRRNKTPKNLS